MEDSNNNKILKDEAKTKANRTSGDGYNETNRNLKEDWTEQNSKVLTQKQLKENELANNSQINITEFQEERSVVSIASITPYQRKSLFEIKAKVVYKSEIIRWSNIQGEDVYFFTIELMDDSGSIIASAYLKECDKFYETIQVDKSYYFSNFRTKISNKYYENPTQKYELTLANETQVILLTDDICVPIIPNNFLPLDKLGVGNLESSSFDVIGVCILSFDLVNFTTERGKQCRRRDIIIADQTMTEVRVALWGEKAETFDGTSNPVVLIKGCNTSNYLGLSLSAWSSSVVVCEPQLPQTKDLRKWYEELSLDAVFNSFDDITEMEQDEKHLSDSKEVIEENNDINEFESCKNNDELIESEKTVLLNPTTIEVFEECTVY